MVARNVVLSQHQHELVDSLVKSGRCQNASEVLREGLRILECRAVEDAARLAALLNAAEKGWSDLAAGRYDDVADENLDDLIGQLGARAARTDCPTTTTFPHLSSRTRRAGRRSSSLRSTTALHHGVPQAIARLVAGTGDEPCSRAMQFIEYRTRLGFHQSKGQIGRSSIRPNRAIGCFEATSIASSRSAHSSTS